MRALSGSLLWLALAAGLTACGGGNLTPSSPVAAGAPAQRSHRHSGSSPIEHVVLIIQENRTFNNFFATYPGADGSTTGKVVPNSYCGFASEQTIKLKESGLITNYGSPPAPHDLTHEYNNGYRIARDNGAMDGFDLIKFDNGAGLPECTFPYQYTNPNDIKPYWDMAKQYALAEHMFTTQGSSSFTAHQDLIAGDTVISANQALVDLPSCSGSKCIWGCDAQKNTHTSLITSDDQYEAGKGPFPCLTYPTIRDSLDAKNVTWRYYVPQMCCSAFGKLLSAFDAIKAVRYGSEWGDGHISTPQTNIFTDITNNQLQAVSWVIPDENASDHPGTSSDTGPSWVSSVVNAIGESSYWNSTAIIIVWDDWGGLYDNLNPPQHTFGGLGFRVPALIISPYAKPGYISTTQYEFGSILKYIEQNWDLKPLKRTDQEANSIADSFNYQQTPIPFKPIKSKYSKAYILSQRPSNLPPDTDF